HSKGDDNRPDEIVKPYRDKDPINVLMKCYEADPRWKAWTQEITAKIEDAVRTADAAPWGEIDEAIDRNTHRPREYTWTRPQFEKEKAVASVRKALEEALNTRDNVVVIGEDIESPYGGAFKCTQGLSAKWPDRCRNTPISELAIVGMGNGLSLRGM